LINNHPRPYFAFFSLCFAFFYKNVKKINTILNVITYPQVVFKLTY